MKRIGIIFGLLGLLNTGAVVYEHEENGAKFYLYNEYIPINSQLFFKNLKTECSPFYIVLKMQWSVLPVYVV